MKLKVYLPIHLRHNEEQSHQKVENLLIELGGGLTKTKGEGYCKNNQDQLIVEEVYIYETYANIASYKELVKTLLVIREESGEDSICYAIDNEAYFV